MMEEITMESEVFATLSLPSANGGVRAFHWARRTFFVLAFFMVAVTLIVVWPYNPVDYHYIQFETPVVKPGHPLIYRIWLTKHTTVTPIITRKLVSIDHPEDDITIQSSTPGFHEIKLPYKRVFIGVPTWVQPGRYYVRATVIYGYWGGNVLVSANYRTPCFEIIR
jgi:hypothetical protein